MEKNNIQYFLNQGKPCPSNDGCSLKRNNYLSEYDTERDKEIVRENLGISDIIERLVDERIGNLTGAINRVWEKIGEITGETFQDIVLTITPEYFIGENGCRIHVIATAGTISGIFEVLQLYKNGELISEHRNVSHLEEDFHIEDTCVLMCKAKINNEWHTVSKTITHYASFWLGAGQTYQEIMTPNNLVPLESTNYDINFGDGNRLFVVVGGELSNEAERFPVMLKNSGISGIGMGGVPVPFTWQEIQIDDLHYSIGESTNSYSGIKNVDINTP